MIRPADPADAPAIAALQNRAIRETDITFTTEEVAEADIAARIAQRLPAFLVAETGTGIAGFATYGPFRSGPGYAFVREHTIHVAPAAWGRGIGRALMQELERVALADGVDILIGGVSATNRDGLAFHTRIGFTETGRLPAVGQKFGRRLDLVLLQKFLRPAGPDGPDSLPGTG
ncbi:GNAT family N-acetyltransferase [Chachezhania antarctica]|uniref:GNAT family N-acetyltransferase n=1 Tax=Chachezhania antarctica TaxID=2340860 RepID=UPI000EB26E13|nr:GNAT family N-acetyltransferase [Chachezhania antarctica]|tara:strand:- start:2281 stop:2802 length:522 start_codon:yes stop_codon:yes gene_type:complete